MVVLVHGDTDEAYGCEQSVASLAQELDHIADVVISVDPLSTGLANDVHGQVATPTHAHVNIAIEKNAIGE